LSAPPPPTRYLLTVDYLLVSGNNGTGNNGGNNGTGNNGTGNNGTGNNGTGNNGTGNNGTNDKVVKNDTFSILKFQLGVWMRTLGLGFKGLGKFNICLPFLPTFPFVPFSPKTTCITV